MEYKTDGKGKLIEYMSIHPDLQFSVEDICMGIYGDEGRKSSVYRQLGALCKSGKVKKFRAEERNAYVYQYVGEGCDCDSHFHLKCISCGKIIHLECLVTGELIDHIMNEHRFSIDVGSSILYGKCADCSSILPCRHIHGGHGREQ